MAVWGDINNDGWLDLFLANGKNKKDILYLNLGDGTFEDISAKSRMTSGGDGLAAMMGDIDNDGYLDIYVARLGSENTLYRNLGDNTFIEVVKSIGATDTRIAMGAIMFDYDNDRDLDIYLVHDGHNPNILYENDGRGYFTDVSDQANVAYESFGMGVDVGDVNNDGHLDIYITNLYENTLLLNNGDKTFTEISESAGITDFGMGWGTGFYDVNNDGWQDIYVGNTPSYPNIMYQNLGDNTFAPISENTILSSTGSSFGVAGADINNDGWLDLFVANSNDKIGSQLFLNQTKENHHWLKVQLEGTTSNRTGIGTRIIAKSGDKIFIDELNSGSSYAGQNSLIMHLGLGEIEMLDSLKILWPSGKIDVMTNVETDQYLSIKESETSLVPPIEVNSQIIIAPNPIVNETEIRYKLILQENVLIEIIDSKGRIISLWDLPQALPGEYIFDWNTEDMLPGVYICKITIGAKNFLKKVIKN